MGKEKILLTVSTAVNDFANFKTIVYKINGSTHTTAILNKFLFKLYFKTNYNGFIVCFGTNSTTRVKSIQLIVDVSGVHREEN